MERKFHSQRKKKFYKDVEIDLKIMAEELVLIAEEREETEPLETRNRLP